MADDPGSPPANAAHSDADAALRESEARLRLVQAAGGIGSFDWDMVSGRIWRSPEYLALHGLPADAPQDGVYTELWRDRLHPDDRAEVERWFEHDCRRPGAFTHEYRIIRADTGETRWIVNRGAVLADAAGTPARLLSAQTDVTERRAEAERLALVQRATGVGAWEFVVGEGLRWSPEIYLLYDRDPALGPPTQDEWRAMLHPDDISAAASPVMDMPVGQLDFDREFRVRRGDGGWRWLAARGHVERDADGRIVRVLGINIDITERKLGEQALRESEERFRRIADSAPVPMWVTQLDRKRSFVNRAYVDFLGISYEEAVDFDWRAIIHPDDGARILKESVEGEASLQPFTLEGRFRRGDGQMRWLRSVSQPRFGPDGAHVGFIGVAHDVTEAKEAEIALRESEAKLRLITDSLPVLISYVDREVRYRFNNRAYEQWFGHARSEIAGKHMREVLGDKAFERIAPLIERALAGEHISAETLLDYKGAGKRHVHLEYVPERGDGGEVTGFYVLVSDISVAKQAEEALRRLNETLEARVAEEIAERLKAEETLRQAQKMEAIGQLTGGIAHDFNNLLTVILSSVDLLKRPTTDSARQARYIDAIGETAGRAAALTNQLLAFARRQPLASEAFDICRRLKGMEPMLRTVLGAKIAFELAVDCGVCLVDADPNQLDTAVLNMTVNARDAMPDGGALSIAARPSDDGDWIELRVTDSGSGIAPDALASIFEPFYTTKGVGKGTGLGLSQVYGFARQSGGEVSVESELGRGSTFTLRLPRSRRDAAAERGDAGSGDPVVAAQARVLVVEDNREVGEAALRLLEDLGHDAALARDAAEALDLVLKQGRPFDLVFSDVIMPGPIDGLGLARLLREQRPDLPVVLTTGYSHTLAEDATHGFEVLRKPYRADSLARLVARMGRPR